MDDSRSAFLEAANNIGARLCRDALWAGNRCNWLGASMEYVGNAWTVVHRVFGPELYSGVSGIALFLGRLFRMTHEKPYRTVAEGGIRQALSRLDDVIPSARIGLYSGLTGIAYALIDLGDSLEDEALIGKAIRVIESLTKVDIGQQDQGLDVVAGSAGAIPALLYIQRRCGQDLWLELALRHGDHLLRKASKSDLGWSWNTLNSPVRQNLCGFSHGAAGIAWALLELYQVTKQERFRNAAEQAFQYERHWFSAEHENWPDFRDLYGSKAGENATPTYMVAWCHGAPGIGLSRFRAYEILGERVYRNEGETALRTTVKGLNLPLPVGQANYSLCHGLGGNAELAIYASQVLGNPEHRAIAEQIGRQGLEQYHKNRIPWPCGVLGGGETPNLMLGLAGIGYFYLRLYDSLITPSVLIITPDRDDASSANPAARRSIV